MRRIVVRLPSSVALVAVQARWQSTSDKEAAQAKEKAHDTPAETPKAPPAADSAAKSSEGGSYRFPTTEVLDAVKKRDFNAVQTHASKLVQSQWRESYNIPAACLVVFAVMWYWISWSRRSIRRKCEAMEAATKQQTAEMVDVVRTMTEKWKTDMAKANQQMQGIIDKNSELTRDIDRLTTALRSCSIRPTAASASAPAPTVTAVRRALPPAAAAAAPTEEAAEGVAEEAVAVSSAPAADKAESNE